MPTTEKTLTQIFAEFLAGQEARLSAHSPSVVIAWLSWKQGWSLDEAERHVIDCHACAPVMNVAGRGEAIWGREQLP